MYKELESPEDAAQYRLKKEHVFTVSNTSCLTWIIRLGAKLMDNKDMVDQQVDFSRIDAPLYCQESISCMAFTKQSYMRYDLFTSSKCNSFWHS